jgi:pimeloyl-ACP methyl ester carboxylesterase
MNYPVAYRLDAAPHGAAPHGDDAMAWGKIAAVAGVALLNYEEARREERKHPPMGEFVDADGTRLHYVRRGAGEQTIVLIHGNGTMVEDYATAGVLDNLAADHRVIAFDRPGYGHSTRTRDRVWTPEAQADLILAALSRLGVERPIVVGHSWGTLVALALALNHPDRVAGLALLSGYYYPTARADVAIFSPPAIPVLGDVIRYTVGPIVGGLILPRMIRKMFRPDPIPQRFKVGFPKGMMLRPTQIKASADDAALMVPSAARFQHRYGQLRMPVSIVAGSGDMIVNHRHHTIRLHGEIPNSNILVLDQCGHMVHHHAPGMIATAIRTIVREANPQVSPKAMQAVS